MRRALAYGIPIILLAASTTLGGHGGPSGAEPVRVADGSAKAGSVSARAVSGPRATSGYLIHIDPVTRAPQKEPAAIPTADLPAALRNAISTSGEGLVEEPNRTAGGTMVNLQGRFQSLQAAAIDAKGRLSVQCLSDHPQGGQRVLGENGGRLEDNEGRRSP